MMTTISKFQPLRSGRSLSGCHTYPGVQVHGLSNLGAAQPCAPHPFRVVVTMAAGTAPAENGFARAAIGDGCDRQRSRLGDIELPASSSRIGPTHRR
jgi:hypothetical protein